MTTTTTNTLSIGAVMSDSELFAPFFSGPSWDGWKALCAAIFGEPLSEADAELFRACTGRSTPPTAAAREAWMIVGRRGGKSRIAALLAVYLGCFRDYSAVLAPGERGVVMVIAADRRQARVVFRYINALIEGVPMLQELVLSSVREALHLSNGISIEIHTASFRAVRGYTVVGAVLDEIAYWPTDDAADPDTEILNALRPAMITVPGALLLGVSSPYARRGELWLAYADHFGKDGDPVFVLRADTRTLNPTVSEEEIAAAYERDEAVAAAEYGAEFRSDVESLFSRDVVAAAVVAGRHEIPAAADRQYVGFVDPSGGSVDSMTLAIAHDANGRAVLDAVRERKPPFSPEEVVSEFAALLQSYRVYSVTGDRYAGEWPRERFTVHGIVYQPAELSKSEIYKALLPTLNSARVDLLDNPRLVAQLSALERRTARGGRDSVDHRPGGHDDVANAAAGALVRAAAPIVVQRIKWL